MHLRVVTASRSRGIGNGLTYMSDTALVPGTLVSVPLRKDLVEGIVIRTEEANTDVGDVKHIAKVLSTEPLIPPSLVKTMVWMAEYYACTLRHALQVFLPPPPWTNLLPIPMVEYRLLKHDAVVRGKKQQAIMGMLREKGTTEETTLRNETGASTATLTALESSGIIERMTRTDSRLARKQEGHSTSSALPSLSASENEAYELLHADKHPGVLLDDVGTDRTLFYATLTHEEHRAGRASIVLFPQVYDAARAYERLRLLLGDNHVLFVHGRMSPAQRRAAFRVVRTMHAPVIVGTRTALFSPVERLGLVIVDDEHEWVYKSEQTPRYHTRLAAEVLATLCGAKLVLASATPSLESWKHGHTLPARYHMAHIRPDIVAALPRITTIDLSQTEFGSLYPFSPPLIEALQARLERKERSVLLLNRRGSATALLCLDCKTTVVSPVTRMPLTVHIVGGKHMLIDHLTGHSEAMPTVCGNCKSTRLHSVGAGTQKIEALLNRIFPKAKVLRADADTLETPDTMEDMIHALDNNRADILVGTQPVLRAVQSPKVTLAAAVLADVGLSQPNFRSGERVFQQLTHLITKMSGKASADIIIQTFRPDAREIKCASQRKTQEYMTAELSLRAQTDYPPTSQMMCLLLRGPGAREQAQRMFVNAKSVASSASCVVTLGPPQPGKPPVWRITLRGKAPRMILNTIPLENAIVDVDPLELD